MPLVIYILGLTIFSLTTSEFMVAGMMPSLTAAFNVSITAIGYLISFYALGMVIGGPILTIGLLKLKVPHKKALLCLLLIYAIAQSVAAMSTTYQVMVIARIITGVAASACFGVALAVCAEVVNPAARGRAASVVVGGLMLATVFGVPMATLVDQYFGWRASFWLVVVLTVVCGLMITLILPKSTQVTTVSLREEFAAFKTVHLWSAYASSGLIIGATFAAFSYFSPLLINITGFSAAKIPLLLAMYGAANVVGNMIVGRFADKYMFPILVCGLTLLVVALAMFAGFADNQFISIMSLIVIGLVGVPMNPAMIARVMSAAHPGALVNTVHTSVINIGLGLGSWLGGVGIQAGYGLRSPLWVGVILAILGLLSLLPYLKREQWTRVCAA